MKIKSHEGWVLSLSSLNPFALRHRMLCSFILLHIHTLLAVTTYTIVCVCVFSKSHHIFISVFIFSVLGNCSEKYHQFLIIFLARRRPGMKEILLLSDCSIYWSLQKVSPLCTVDITVQQRISKFFSSENQGDTTQPHSAFLCVACLQFFWDKEKMKVESSMAHCL